MTDTETEFDWHKFFLDAGIPESHALSYADVFVDNRITEIMLEDLTKEILAELGVAAIGDVLAIHKAAKMHSSSNVETLGVTKSQKQMYDRRIASLEEKIVSERRVHMTKTDILQKRVDQARQENRELRKELEQQLLAAKSALDDEPPVTTITLDDLDDEPVTGKGKRRATAVTAAHQAAAQSKAAKRQVNKAKGSVLSRLSGGQKKTKGRGFKAKDDTSGATRTVVTGKRNIQARLSRS
eukprot:m.54612 g.54612  ORF g.54612 m.54612 type:complete len:240 (-) comp13636_c0_seq2:207-926(-)